MFQKLIKPFQVLSSTFYALSEMMKLIFSSESAALKPWLKVSGPAAMTSSVSCNFSVTTLKKLFDGTYGKKHLFEVKQRKSSVDLSWCGMTAPSTQIFSSLRFSLTQIYQIPLDEIFSVMVMPGQSGDFIPATAWGETTSDQTEIRLKPRMTNGDLE